MQPDHLAGASTGLVESLLSSPTDQIAPLVSRIKALEEAARACHAWHVAEDRGLGTFQQRMELCHYSEYLTEQVLLGGDTPYEGVPRITLFPIEIQRDTAEQAEAIIAEVFALLSQPKD
jgi:hypothetical protein